MPHALPFAFLALVSLVLALALSCGGGSTATTGAGLFIQQGCPACHGAQGEGKSLGPSLRRAEEHWTEETLAAFLLDPAGTIAGNPRLEAIDARYRTDMVPYAMLGPEERARLAAFVLALE